MRKQEKVRPEEGWRIQKRLFLADRINPNLGGWFLLLEDEAG